MKKIVLLLMTVLCSLGVSAQTESAFYNLPEGAFVSGMTSTAALSTPQIYAPYSKSGLKFTSVTGDGDWYTNGTKRNTSGVTGSTTINVAFASQYYIPELKIEGLKDYSYGCGSSSNKYVYSGYGTMVYMTPAKIWCDLIQASSGQAQSLLSNYKTSTNDVMGVFFDNKDVMYIDGISIPITSNTSGQTVDDLFPNEGSHIIVNIYPATITKNAGKYTNVADRTKPIWTGTLTKANFVKNASNAYRGGVNVTFDSPISIEGAFCIELSDMKNSGCAFYIYSAKERSGCNYFGYYLKDGKETYPNPYTLAVSVHAMFPALYKDDASQEELNVMAGGSTKVAIHSNVDPAQFTIECPEWITYDISYEDAGGFKTTDLSYITFTSSNTSVTEPGTITINNRGKEISYTINQTSSIFEKGDNVETIRFVPSKTDNKTVAITTNLAPEAVAVTNTASEWLDYELTAVEGGLNLKLTTKGAATVSRKGVVTLTADNKTVSYDVRQDVVKLVVGDAKWATYAGPIPLTPNDKNLVVKTVAYTDGKLEYTDAASITAFVPVVLFSETAVTETRNFSTSTYNYVFEDSYTSGPLVGVLADTKITPASTDSYNYYFLQNLDGEVAWYLGQEDVTYTVTANHCYLKIEKSAGAPVRAFYFDAPTGIDALTTQIATGTNVRTNLAGQVVNDSYKGIVIENGKKFIKK